MCDAPRDGTPIIVCDVDGSGVFIVAALNVNGRLAWYECRADNEPAPVAYTHLDDLTFAAAWVPFPDGLKNLALRYVIEQYGADAIPSA